jgi:hypothetical protein
MNKLSLNKSWIFLLIPIGLVFFVLVPELQGKYDAFNKQEIELQQKIYQLDSLKQLNEPTKKDLRKIKNLEIETPIKKLVFGKQRYLYYKIGGMLVVFIFMFGGMMGSSYWVKRKKSSSKNKQISFTFEDFSQDAIGQQVSWEATENSGSNFLSEHFKKSRLGHKISSSSYMKFVAWGFFLIGVNSVVWSYMEFFEFSKLALTFMKGGKLFFTSGGGIFLLIGVFLLISSGAKANFLTQKRKIILGDAEIVPFQQTYALQVLEKFIPGKSSGGYFCYEVNLITKEGKRFNLLNHGDKQYILSDMMKISKLLNIPVWNKNVS